MNQQSMGRSGNDQRSDTNNWDGTGNNQDGTVAPPGPIQTPAELRQSTGCRQWCPGGAPVNAGRVWV
ncbi:hypothetical protein DPMN_116451 [Dreissena polymorpha]|uniref:Uncharacterized protein n=1 Tax=Dreissena polymorpha TaxID=45954 RepID=A0A9D4KN26_DREPO|nr:hypothetical protein DPMN_116451 [Dreissena polymorpha]